MSLAPINAVMPDASKPSALDNAAKILGVVGTLAGAAGQAYGAYAGNQALAQKQANMTTTPPAPPSVPPPGGTNPPSAQQMPMGNAAGPNNPTPFNLGIRY